MWFGAEPVMSSVAPEFEYSWVAPSPKKIYSFVAEDVALTQFVPLYFKACPSVTLLIDTLLKTLILLIVIFPDESGFKKVLILIC